MVREWIVQRHGGNNKMTKQNVQKILDETPEIQEFLKDNGISDVNRFFKEALESHLENNKKKNESIVDKWIRVLNGLIEWSNEGNDETEMK